MLLKIQKVKKNKPIKYINSVPVYIYHIIRFRMKVLYEEGFQSKNHTLIRTVVRHDEKIE